MELPGVNIYVHEGHRSSLSIRPMCYEEGADNSDELILHAEDDQDGLVIVDISKEESIKMAHAILNHYGVSEDGCI